MPRRQGRCSSSSPRSTASRYELCGKLVVALDESELERLEKHPRVRAEANGVEGLREISPRRMRELEPHAVGVRALRLAETGIINFRRVAFAIADEVRALGGEIDTSSPVTAIEERRDGDLRFTSAAPTGSSATSRAATGSPARGLLPTGSPR